MTSRILETKFQAFFLLLLMLGDVLTLPALDTKGPLPVTPNTIEETDKLADSSVDAKPASDLEQSNVNETNAAISPESSEQSVPDNVASASSIDPASIYASGLITPEVFQQYLSQYGAAAYGPFAGAYPAPGLYPYPGPIVVQTGYEGFLAPAAVSQLEGTTVAAAPTPASSSNPLLAFASKLLPTILMSTLFRIAAVIVSAVGVILFGGAITSALCRLTPICEIPAKAVDILRSGGAQDVGRMLAEEMTPERVRRATEFVRNAIRKYRQLQQFTEEMD
ncbi:uncharacterized protein Dwil_GK11199 [Drosophila willistoni]|uniref:CG10035-PA n=1 Tax=Drosophila willistoni TaxID=7260 RepID=B4NBE0_DROWI|nr:uncharacterized protein LOC6647131 [Drosophila willistoni]EDW81104.1 uncharacterized protein Dwil_GK11199 [Drosophila willistoni]